MQSALSQQIGKLEGELSTRLLQRTARGDFYRVFPHTLLVGLFATRPCAKFAHGVFRKAALLRHAVEKRWPPTETPSVGRVRSALSGPESAQAASISNGGTTRPSMSVKP